MTKASATKTSVLFFSIFFIALLIRIIYIIQQIENPLFSYPLGDAENYVSDAEKILSGNWMGDRVFAFGGSAIYPYFLAIIFKFFGKNYLVVQILQYVMGSFTCGIIYLTGSRLFDQNVGLILGVIAALFPPLLFHEGLLLTSALTIFLLSLSFYTFLIWTETRQKIFILIISGLLLGLSILCRPNLILFIPAFILFLYKLSPEWKSKATGIALFLCGVFTAIAPVTIRNYIVEKDFVLISSSGGFNFFLGNNPQAKGVFFIPPNLGIQNDATMYLTSQATASSEIGHTLTPSQSSGYWQKRGISYIINSPADAAALSWKKLLLFFNHQELTNLYKYSYFQNYSFLIHPLNPLFSVTMILGLVGAFWMLWCGEWKEKTVPILFFTYSFSVIIFFVSSRLRIPLALFQIFSVGYFLKRVRSIQGVKQKSTLFSSIFIFFLLVHHEIDKELEESVRSQFHAYVQIAYKAKEAKDYKQALHFFQIASEERPENIMVLIDAGQVALKLRQMDKARNYFQEILILTDNIPESSTKQVSPISWSNPAQMTIYMATYQIGIIYYNEKEYSKAVQYLTRASNLFPPGLQAQLYLAFSYEAMRDLDAALLVYDKYLAGFPNPTMQKEMSRVQQMIR